MSDGHVKYQGLSRQEALAIEREVELMIKYAFQPGLQANIQTMRVQAATLGASPSGQLH